ncbi:MAG: ureidoglycolate hydrolase [Betaproteobacteria bacterium]|nr:ureidoglycolate hydrolase [Betaproteobacteria bacterium]
MDGRTQVRSIGALPLQREHYLAYGDVIAVDPALASASANNGTARRFDHVGAIENLRPAVARPNLCLFRVQPCLGGTFEVRMLERHHHSTQVFLPLGGARTLVIVCGGGNQPDPQALAAFVAGPGAGFSYRPGTWHHPLVALDRESDYACLVHEDGGEGDCEVRELPVAVRVTF